MNGYKLNLTDKTLTITKAFEDAVNTGEGDEYQILMKFQRDIPGLRIVRKTHKTPTKYINTSGEVTRCNQFKNLTYERMERFIGGLSNSDEVMNAYTFIRENASKVSTSPYAVVRKWFAAQFPNYRKATITKRWKSSAPSCFLRRLRRKPTAGPWKRPSGKPKRYRHKLSHTLNTTI